MNYWKDIIEEALDDANISATNEQIDVIAGLVEGAHENYGMAHGYEAIPNPAESAAHQELARCQSQLIEMRKAYNNLAHPDMLLDKNGNRSVFDDLDQ